MNVDVFKSLFPVIQTCNDKMWVHAECEQSTSSICQQLIESHDKLVVVHVCQQKWRHQTRVKSWSRRENLLLKTKCSFPFGLFSFTLFLYINKCTLQFSSSHEFCFHIFLIYGHNHYYENNWVNYFAL